MNNLENIKNKKIAFFGTPDFTVEFLELFKSLGLNISLIVTSEDKPAGRGMQIKSPGPKLFAEKNGIKYLQPKKLLEIEKELENFDLFIVIAYGKIILENIINLPTFGTINLHYSLLPKYRGASPVETAILNGDTETGITIQQMVYKLDAGNILFKDKISINEDETADELRGRLNNKALEIFPGFLEKFFSESTSPSLSLQRRGTAQNETEATSCGKFIKQDLDVTDNLKNKNLDLVYKKYKAFNKKFFFFFDKNDSPLRVKITSMSKNEILKVLPENKKEILVKDLIFCATYPV
jgi:methionyl-tRNA formyltransferase